MGLRYVPVPHEAFTLCDGPLQIAFVAQLYKEAHERFWRPICRSMKSMARDAGIPPTSLRRLFKRLEQSGLLQFSAEKTGNRNEGTWFRLEDPNLVHDAVHDRSTETKVNGASPEHAGPPEVHNAVHALGPRAREPEPEPKTKDLDPSQNTHTHSTVSGEIEAEADPDSVCVSSLGEEWDRISSFWNKTVSPALGQEPIPLTPDEGVGARLANAVKRHPGKVMNAMRFVAESPHRRARWFREESGHGLHTVLNKIDEYDRMWRQPPKTPASTSKPNENRGLRLVREYRERQAAIQRQHLLEAHEVLSAK